MIAGVLIAVFAAGVLFVIVWMLFQRVRVEITYPDTRLQTRRANCFGQRSKGMFQITGNGVFTLTGSMIYFDMYVPARHFEISLHSIAALDTVHSFKGKATAARLLKIEFQNELGEPDAIAWWVPDLEGVIAAIEAAKAELR